MRPQDILREAREKLEMPKLAYKRDALAPVMSEETVDVHYGILTKNYVEKFNATGDEFQYAGAFLHEKLWEQFDEVARGQTQNKPDGKIKQLIEEKFKGFDKLKEAIEEAALKIHGSGWVYLAKSGEIKTIKNHEVKKDILILIDMWEHAYFLDYEADKKKYLSNIWKIINWETINHRI